MTDVKSIFDSIDNLILHIGPYIQLLAFISLLTFFVSLFVIPWYIAQLPNNHFKNILQEKEPHRGTTTNFLILITRNIFGAVLLVAGFIMLFIPGQGLLTLLFGIMCISFPYKRNIIKYLLEQQSIRRSLNWSREKLSKPPFIWK